MRIALVIRSLNFGGAERQLVLLASGLTRLGHKVSVHVFYAGGEFEPELRANGVKVVVIGKSGRWDSLRFIYRALRGIRAERPDIVHAYLGGANIFVCLFRRFFAPAPIVLGIRSSRVNYQEFGWFFRVTTNIEGSLSRYADLVIANSSAGREASIQRGFPKERVIVVPNGVELDRFTIEPELRANFRARWGIGDREIAIGRVGRIDVIKDLPTFLRSAAAIFQKRKDVRFLCIGPGKPEYIQELQSLAMDLGIGERVLWTGATQAMNEAYNGLDLLVSSSISEGFPNVLLEAMACGLPCVTTDCGDAAGIVANLGRVVPVGDPAAMAEACLSLLASRPNPQIIRESIRSRFAVDALVERTEGLLASLIADPAVLSGLGGRADSGKPLAPAATGRSN